MRITVCDVVKNSIWYDPRVTKQLKEYSNRNIRVIGLGIVDGRYDEDEIKKLPCETLIVGDMDRGKTIFKQAIWEWKTNKEIYRRLLELKPNVIHANDLNALIPSCKAAKKLKCKVIYDSHEIFIENLWIARNKVVKAVYGFYEKKLFKRVDLLICVSNAAKDYLNKKYKVKDSIVVTNSISCDIINKLEFQSKSDEFEVLNHGQFYEGRGYDLMVQAANLLQQSGEGNSSIKFVLRGFGTMEQELKDYAQKQDLKNVVFEPPVKTYQLVSYASRSHVGIAITEPICLNFELSVSNKLFEYAAAGLPVIMSNIPEHVLLNEKYKFGIILDENTPDCLANAVEILYKDQALYHELEKNAIAFSKDICWEKEYDKLFNTGLFEEMKN